MPQGNGSLEDRMNRAMEVWLANPLSSYEDIAIMAGIGDKTFYRYRQNPEFMNEYHQRQKERFASLEGKAVAKLEQKLDEGEWRAIQYTLDGMGYKPTDKVEVAQTVISVSVEDDD